jgi:hypothetical protein
MLYIFTQNIHNPLMVSSTGLVKPKTIKLVCENSQPGWISTETLCYYCKLWDCKATSNLFSSYIMTRTSYIWWDENDVCFAPDQPTCLPQLDFIMLAINLMWLYSLIIYSNNKVFLLKFTLAENFPPCWVKHQQVK